MVRFSFSFFFSGCKQARNVSSSSPLRVSLLACGLMTHMSSNEDLII